MSANTRVGVFRRKLLFISIAIITVLSLCNKQNFISMNNPFWLAMAWTLDVFLIYVLGLFFIRIKNKYYDFKFLVYLSAYSLVIAVLVCLVYPAVISWGDMTGIYNSVVQGEILWQFVYVTSLFHMAAKLMIPTIAAPMILQGIFLIAFAGHFSKRLHNIFKTSYIWGYFPFVLAPILFYGLYPNRMPLYSLFYSYYISELLFDYKEKKSLPKRQIIFYIIGGALLAVWRTEGVIFLALLPAVILLIKEQCVRLKSYIVVFFMILSVYLVLAIPQKINYNLPASSQSGTILMGYLTALAYEGYHFDNERDEDILNVLGQYVSFEKIEHQVQKLGIHCLGEVNGNFGEHYAWLKDKNSGVDDFTDFYIACARLFMSHPILTFQARVDMCRYSLTGKGSFADGDPVSSIKNYYLGAENMGLYSSPHRHYFNYLLSRTVYPGGELQTKIMARGKAAMYCTSVPVIALALISLFEIIKKKNKLFITLLIWWLLHFATLFISAPAGYFMYYLPFYLTGYCVLIMEICSFIKGRQQL